MAGGHIPAGANLDALPRGQGLTADPDDPDRDLR